MAKSIKEINNLYRETFKLDDEAIIPLLSSIIVLSKLDTPPVWLYLIGPSSGGKSELINIFGKVNFVTQISDITPNTFLSGMVGGGKENSLLKQLGNNFVITMKDFTTLLSKSDDTLGQIIAQMREIYDGHFVKQTGTGRRLEWGPNAKATFIMASTEAIYGTQEKFSEMGTRAINYVLKEQNRKEVTKRAIKNNNTLKEAQYNIQNEVRDFIMEKTKNLPAFLPELPEEIEDEIIDISDFSTKCRSIVKRDYRGEKSLALSPEMPMRMSKALLSIAQGLIYINDGETPSYFKEVINKVAFDTIPKQRKIVIEILAKYNEVETIAVATAINYNPQRAREWLEDLNMFQVCDRVKRGSRDNWVLRKEYRDIMAQYYGISSGGKDLLDDGKFQGGGYQDIDLSWSQQETEVTLEEEFNKI